MLKKLYYWGQFKNTTCAILCIIYILCELHVASPISTVSTCLFVYLAVVFYPAWEEGEVEVGDGGGCWGGAPLCCCSSFGDWRVWAHETAGVLQKPIIEAPGPLPGCL